MSPASIVVFVLSLVLAFAFIGGGVWKLVGSLPEFHKGVTSIAAMRVGAFALIGAGVIVAVVPNLFPDALSSIFKLYL
jgi:hypothetical protein